MVTDASSLLVRAFSRTTVTLVLPTVLAVARRAPQLPQGSSDRSMLVAMETLKMATLLDLIFKLVILQSITAYKLLLSPM